MKNDLYFWYSLPLFVAISGNFSPFRFGPILPIYFLFGVYTLLNLKIVGNFFAKNKLAQICGITIIPYFFIFALAGIHDYSLRGNEFLGSIDPLLYSVFTFLHYTLGVFLLVVLANKFYPRTDYIYRSLLTCYLILFLALLAQLVLLLLFGVEFGYIFPVGDMVRYGGIIGEPQTLAAWMFSLFFLLYSFQRPTGFSRSHTGWLLIASQVVSLLLTQSTAWIVAFCVFLLIRAGRRTRLFLAVLILLAFQVFDASIFEKVYVELFHISERSITVVAGFELFSANIYKILFGYGLGLSPYILSNADIFMLYPKLNLAELGRQNVMNSYLEIVFELGLVGSALIFTLMYVAIRIKKLKSIIQILPLFVGIFGVGGGLFSGYFLLAMPLIVRLSANNLTGGGLGKMFSAPIGRNTQQTQPCDAG
ncbi:MAG: hypothetical protein ACYC2W_05685 [Desulfurivibrionaceae bacterium]